MVILISPGGLGPGTLSNGVGEAIHGVAAVGALPLGFQVTLGLVRGKYLPAGLHAAEASYVSSSSISAFGLLRCLLPTHLLSLISLMGLWVFFPYCLGQVSHDAQVSCLLPLMRDLGSLECWI